jgi:hypothetical protein
VVFHGRDAVRIGQQLIEVTIPARRIVSLAKAADGSPVENALDTTADAGGGLGSGLPDGTDYLHDQVGADGSDRQRADHRRDMGGQGVFPLADVFRVSPATAVRSDIRRRARVKTDLPGALERGGGVRLLA